MSSRQPQKIEWEMKLKNQGKKLLVVFNKMDKLENDKLAFDKFTHSCGSDSSG